MAKKIKKVSISSIDKAIKENMQNTVALEWYGIEIEVKKAISMHEALEYVNNCVDAVIDEETYLPEAYDFMVRSNLIEKYTNISLPDSLTHRYDILFTSDIVGRVMSVIDMPQYEMILNAIDQKIEYKKTMNTFELNMRVSRLISAFENVYEQTENVYSGLDADDLKKILSAVSNADFNEESLVKAYMNNTKEESDE